MYEKRIKHLQEMHAILDKKIDGMEKTGVFEDVSIETLKKQRLHIRDEIAKLTNLQQDHNNKNLGFDQ